jgi:glucose/arabinose dehydrogenase
MKTSITSNLRPLLRAFQAFLIAIAVLLAMPRDARAQLYFTSRPVGSAIGVVSEYDATTGAVINASLITGLSNPGGLAVKGNTLFVANSDGGTVGKYDATTGGAINPGFITGLETPSGIALRGNTLFVANFHGTVGEYNASTGEVINANFITGLTNLGGIAVKSAK